MKQIAKCEVCKQPVKPGEHRVHHEDKWWHEKCWQGTKIYIGDFLK